MTTVLLFCELCTIVELAMHVAVGYSTGTVGGPFEICTLPIIYARRNPQLPPPSAFLAGYIYICSHRKQRHIRLGMYCQSTMGVPCVETNCRASLAVWTVLYVLLLTDAALCSDVCVQRGRREVGELYINGKHAAY